MNAVHFIAQKNAMTLPISRVGMVFINGMAVFHARSEFNGGDASWVLPQSLQETFGARCTRKPGDLSPEVWGIDHEPVLEELSFVNG
ncbi:Clavaminate synthase [Fusarium circinatum]|uniref:Clavaminate synthase n=1 Tax=Fusarium circinatum TaxID=48490 RepID=A0A8H5TYW2_FUSCI|nr:Clavaminate synthase [Fusarium circinatum]